MPCRRRWAPGSGVPDAPVAALIGDYGFQYTMAELGTAAELGQPLVILLWNNDALGQIRDDMVRKGIQPNAVSARNPDFQALFGAYGCHAEKPVSVATSPRPSPAPSPRPAEPDRDDAAHDRLVRGLGRAEHRPSCHPTASRRRDRGIQ
jgi:thiamine pyrophosphate-dependent acetolactate synthase large subunit-like protein